MKSTQAGVGKILTEREKRPTVGTKLDDDLPVNPLQPVVQEEIVDGRPVYRTKNGYQKT
jgi:hypothetical protein